MEVLVEIFTVPWFWWLRKPGRGQITAGNDLIYEFDINVMTPNKLRYELTRDGIKIERNQLKGKEWRRWEILRAGKQIAIVDERYWVNSSGMYDLIWEGKTYKSFLGQRSQSDAPSFRPPMQWPKFSLPTYDSLFDLVRSSTSQFIDELDPDIAAILALHDHYRLP